MRVSEIMSKDVKLARPDQTIQEAAKIMVDIDAGVLPVSKDDRLIGMVTDRDITARAVAQGKGPKTPVEDVMTRDTKYCYEDQDTAEIAVNMRDVQLRRLPVVSRDKRLVGIVSLADLAMHDGPGKAGQAIAGISEPSGARRQ